MTGNLEHETLPGPEPQPATAATPAGEPAIHPAAPAAGAGRLRPRRRTWLAAIAGVLVLPVAVAAGISWTATTTDIFRTHAADARVVSAADLEEQYGIRVNLVAVSAAGGMIDMRFTVTDQSKAEALLHDATTEPALYVESSGAVLRAPTGMRHKVTILDGGNYFILYGNPGGAIQAGTPVSVVINDIRLAPITAQS